MPWVIESIPTIVKLKDVRLFSFYFWGCECRVLFVHRPPALSEYRLLIGSSCFSVFVEGGS